jgi:hypothetical protein
VEWGAVGRGRQRIAQTRPGCAVPRPDRSGDRKNSAGLGLGPTHDHGGQAVRYRTAPRRAYASTRAGRCLGPPTERPLRFRRSALSMHVAECISGESRMSVRRVGNRSVLHSTLSRWHSPSLHRLTTSTPFRFDRGVGVLARVRNPAPSEAVRGGTGSHAASRSGTWVVRRSASLFWCPVVQPHGRRRLAKLEARS